MAVRVCVCVLQACVYVCIRARQCKTTPVRGKQQGSVKASHWSVQSYKKGIEGHPRHLKKSGMFFGNGNTLEEHGRGNRSPESTKAITN